MILHKFSLALNPVTKIFYKPVPVWALPEKQVDHNNDNPLKEDHNKNEDD